MLRAERPGVLLPATLLVVFFLLMAATIAQPAPVAVPVFSVETEKIDLGVVPEGEEVTAEFIVHNQGEAELRILKAKPS